MTAAATIAIELRVARGSFVATFRPAPHWSRWIQRHAGVRCAWRPVWRIGHGPFRGEMACVPLNGAAKGLAWAPESELVERADRGSF